MNFECENCGEGFADGIDAGHHEINAGHVTTPRKQASPHRYACDRCGKRQPADRMIYSRHTRLRYCLDFESCDRRAKRLGRLK